VFDPQSALEPHNAELPHSALLPHNAELPEGELLPVVAALELAVVPVMNWDVPHTTAYDQVAEVFQMDEGSGFMKT
jgi:hypothetical protein